MWKCIFRLFATSCFLLSVQNLSYAGVDDLINGLRRLIGSDTANQMDHLLNRTPGRFFDMKEIEGLIRSDRGMLQRGLANRASFSPKQLSQARIIDRLIYEIEAVLDVPNPNFSKFTQEVVRLPIANLARRGISVSSQANIWYEFQRAHRGLQVLLDQFEVLRGRFLKQDPKLEEYLDGLGKSYSSHRALAETLGDIVTKAEMAIAQSVVGEAEKLAFFTRLFNHLDPIFAELQSAKILMEIHTGRVSKWIKTAEDEPLAGFNDFLERHAHGTLSQRFARIYRVSEGSTEALQKEYATLFKPLISEQKVGEAEEMLTLLWSRENFNSVKETIFELRQSLAKYPDLIDFASEIDGIVKARSLVIDGRLSQARLRILLPVWDENAHNLKYQLTKVQSRATNPMPDLLNPSVLPLDIRTHIISELNRVVDESKKSAASISELIGDVDDFINALTSKDGLMQLPPLLSLKMALSTLKQEVGRITNSFDNIKQLNLRVTGELNDELSFVIPRPELRTTLREFIDLRLKIVEDLEVQTRRGAVTY